MAKESEDIVKALRDGAIKWDEFYRTVSERTIVSALAAVYLGSSPSNPRANMEKAWPTVIGDMVAPMHTFLESIRANLDSGSLLIGDQTSDFEEPATRRMTWKGVFSRTARYLSSPSYSFFNLGQLLKGQSQGNSQMRRIAREDDRTCPDCSRYASMGWQPLGSLPMPGRQCECFDRCRCSVEYR